MAEARGKRRRGGKGGRGDEDVGWVGERRVFVFKLFSIGCRHVNNICLPSSSCTSARAFRTRAIIRIWLKPISSPSTPSPCSVHRHNAAPSLQLTPRSTTSFHAHSHFHSRLEALFDFRPYPQKPNNAKNPKPLKTQENSHFLSSAPWGSSLVVGVSPTPPLLGPHIGARRGKILEKLTR